MDLGTIIIGVIILVGCTLPFGIAYLNVRKSEGKMLQMLKDQAQLHSCTISQHEFCGDFVLGIDGNKKCVFFLKKKNDEFLSQFVDLSEVQTCQAKKQIRNIQTHNENILMTERIDLYFSPNGKNKSETLFELFDDRFNMRLTDELQFAEEWSKKLTESLVAH